MDDCAGVSSVELGADDHHDRDDDDDAEALAMIQDMPAPSSCSSELRFWCHASFAPALLIGMNVVVFAMLASYNYRLRLDEDDRQRDGDSLALRSFRINTAVAAAALLADAFLVRRMAVLLERDIRAWREETLDRFEVGSSSCGSRPQQQQEQKHVFARASRRIDSFLRHRPPSGGGGFVPALVSLLHLLSVACGAVGLVSASLRAYGATSHFAAHCDCAPSEWNGDDGKKQANVPGIPGPLQEWARSKGRGWDEEKPNFAHLSDGRTFFKAQEARSADDNAHDSRRILPVLAAVDLNKSAAPVLYREVGYPSDFRSLGANNSGEGADAFCCVYSPRLHRKHRGEDIHFLCVMSHLEGTLNSSIAEKKRNRWRWRYGSAVGLNGTYWYHSRWREEVCSLSGCNNQEYEEYYSVTPPDMTVVSVANATINEDRQHVFDNFGKLHGGACARYQGWMAGSVIVPAAIAGSWYLARKKDLPSGTVPLTMAATFVLDAIDEKLCRVTVDLLVLTTSVLLISRKPSCMKRESIVWIHYSLFLFLPFWTRNDTEPPLELLLCLVVSVTLDHPILQVFGWVVIPFMYLISWTGIITFAIMDDHDVPAGVGVLLFSACAMLLLACGLISAGEALRRYRAYIIFYVRRTWAVAKGILRERASAAPATREGENMTRSLLD